MIEIRDACIHESEELIFITLINVDLNTLLAYTADRFNVLETLCLKVDPTVNSLACNSLIEAPTQQQYVAEIRNGEVSHERR